MKPLVSIVINNYNYGRFLGRAIDSALAQSYEPLEVVVVDDGSKDDSLDVARGYGDRITLVAKENGGQASALNAGFAAAAGAIVVFLDSDDELYPQVVDRVVAAWLPGTAKAHWRLDEVDEAGRRLDRVNPPARARLGSGDVQESLLRKGRYTTPVMSGNAFARATLEALVPVPEDRFPHTADGYLVALAGLVGPVVAVDEPLGVYRRHSSNIWASASVDTRAIQYHVEQELAVYDELAKFAAAQGLVMDPDVGLRDHAGLRSRLASFRLAPSSHPGRGDRRLQLVLAELRALQRSDDLTPRSKAVFSAWTVGVGVAPRPLARTLVTWLYVPGSRPPLRGMLGRLRPSRSHPPKPQVPSAAHEEDET